MVLQIHPKVSYRKDASNDRDELSHLGTSLILKDFLPQINILLKTVSLSIERDLFPLIEDLPFYPSLLYVNVRIFPGIIFKRATRKEKYNVGIFPGLKSKATFSRAPAI